MISPELRAAIAWLIEERIWGAKFDSRELEHLAVIRNEFGKTGSVDADKLLEEVTKEEGR